MLIVGIKLYDMQVMKKKIQCGKEKLSFSIAITRYLKGRVDIFAFIIFVEFSSFFLKKLYYCDLRLFSIFSTQRSLKLLNFAIIWNIDTIFWFIFLVIFCMMYAATFLIKLKFFYSYFTVITPQPSPQNSLNQNGIFF